MPRLVITARLEPEEKSALLMLTVIGLISPLGRVTETTVETVAVPGSSLTSLTARAKEADTGVLPGREGSLAETVTA